MVCPLQSSRNDPVTWATNWCVRHWVAHTMTVKERFFGWHTQWRLRKDLLKRGAYILFGWHTQWQLRKDFNKQYTNKILHHKILYNISSNINKQTNNNIMQDHAKQRYIFGHLSLIRSLAFNIPSGVATMRDASLKKRDLGTYLGHLSFWVSSMESPLIFLYTKKIRKNKYMTD